MRNLVAIGGTVVLLVSSQLACCRITMPTIEIDVPEIEAGPLREKEETIPLPSADSVRIEVLFGAGELAIAPGATDDLMTASFLYNVEEWEPEMTYEDDVLTIRQGDPTTDWGWPTDDGYRNEWELAFSPAIPLEVEVKAGAGSGELDLSGLQLTELDLELGAGEFSVRFDEPNAAEMGRLDLDAGASQLELSGAGYASPRRMVVRSGAGDATLELTGEWSRSADIDVTAGVGQVTLRLPDDVGVRVDVEGGLASVKASGLRRSGDAYVNDAYGEAEIELDITVTAGVGQVNLIQVSND